MIDSRQIQDDFGNSISMLDAYGNLSVQVIMLYAEDKLTEADRKAVDDFAATDEMCRDALDGYALLPQTTNTRMVIGNLNTEIQNKTGSAPLPIQMQSKAPFNYRRLAAAITLLIVIGGGTFWASKFFSNHELAEDITLVNSDDSTASEIEVLPNVNESDAGADDVEELAPSKVKSTLTDEASSEKDVQPKREEDSEAISIKSLEKNATTATAAADNKRPDVANVPIQEQKARSEDVAQKVAAADAGLAQPQGKATANNEIHTNSDKKAKDSLAKEAESRASAERMRQESANAEMQRERYDDAYEPASATTSVQQASNASDLSAKFPGGDAAMSKFIEKKKSYPEALRAQNVTGAISIWFDIETDGRVTNARIKSGENGMLTEDALRVVRSMPKWSPAKNSEGQAIKSSRTVVIKYGQ